MKYFVLMLIGFVLMNLGLIVLGTVFGFLLHWTFSAVDLGSGILIGVVTSGFTIHYFFRILNFLESYQIGSKSGENDDPRGRPYPGDPMPSWPRRRRRQP